MREYKVELHLNMEYNGESVNDVLGMVDEEFGLGDKQFDLWIDGVPIYGYDDVNSVESEVEK